MQNQPDRTCTACQMTLPCTEFSFSAGGKRKRWASLCKGCTREYNREHYKKTADEKNAKARAKYVSSDGSAKIGRPVTRTPEDVRRQNHQSQAMFRLTITVEQRLLSYAKTRARAGGYPCTITLADIVIPDKCPVLGIPLFPGAGKVGRNSPTLDKINPTLGYVPGNVAVISFRANTIKQDASVEELLLVASYVKERS